MLWPRVNRLTYENDVLQLVEEENHSDQKCQVIVAGDHMFGAEVDEGGNRGALIGLDKAGVPLGDVVGACGAREHQSESYENGYQDRGPGTFRYGFL